MIINWLKNKFIDYPIFYKKYLKTFDRRILNEFIVFDFEIINNKITKIFAIKIKNQKLILKDYIEINIQNQAKEVFIEEAVIQFLKFIDNIPLISFLINEKIELVNQILYKMNAGKIENELFSIDILFHSLENKTEYENLELFKIAENLKLDEFYFENLIKKVYLEALIFLKLNSTLKIENILK